MQAGRCSLPEAEQIRLRDLPEPVFEETAVAGGMLEHVHWSWLLPALKTYPAKEQKLFLSSLAPLAAQALSQALDLPDYEQTVSEIARSFFTQHLLHSLLGPKDRILPIEYLPASSLKPLLALSKKDLTRLIEFLSLYDLAHELRQIVETKILKKIYSFLSEEERKFLKAKMAQQKEPFSLPRFGLDRWDGTEESFRHLLHRKGLSRFAIALSGQNPDFVWYVCHQLDIGRGNTLFKLCAKEAVPNISEAIIRQIEELLAKELQP